MRNFKGKYITSEDLPSMIEVSDEFLFMTHLRRHLYRTRKLLFLYLPSSNHELTDEQQGVLDLIEAMEAADLVGKPIESDYSWDSLPQTIKDTFERYYELNDQRLYTKYSIKPRLWKELQQSYYSWHLYEGRNTDFH